MDRIQRKCMSIMLLLVLFGFVSVSCQLFDKKPTIYDHVKYGQPSSSTQIESELKIETQSLPAECTPVDKDDFFGDREEEIKEKSEKLRKITVEDGDTVTMHFTIYIEDVGEIETTKGETEDGEEKQPIKFTIGKYMVIQGLDVGTMGMCVGETRKLTIPPQLAWGSKGFKPLNVPGDTTIWMETELVELKKKDIVDYYFDFLHNLHYFAFLILGLTFLLQGFYKSKMREKKKLLKQQQEALENLNKEKKRREIEEKED